MRIIVAGCDGYLGFPLTQTLLNRGHEVLGLDCFHRRHLVAEIGSQSAIPISSWTEREKTLKDLGDFSFERIDIAEEPDRLQEIFEEFEPEAIANLAQQPSPAYSQIGPREGNFTQRNNNQGLLNIMWAMKEKAPYSAVTTLGTLGEMGQPNMDIPEGFFEVEFHGMKDVLWFPREPGSIYHTSKVQSSHNAWWACKTWELRATDIMQGVVYGTRIPEMTDNHLRTRFDFDECFGTMVNRAVACAVMGHPIVLYGSGMQNRGYIALRDSMQCLALSLENPPKDADSFHGYRVLNQLSESYSCLDIGRIVKEVGNEEFDLGVEIEHVENPRIEKEVHYWNPIHEKLPDMGFTQTKNIKEELELMFEDLIPHEERFIKSKAVPKIKWRGKYKEEKK